MLKSSFSAEERGFGERSCAIRFYGSIFLYCILICCLSRYVSFFGMNVSFLRITGMRKTHCLNVSFFCKVLISGAHFSCTNHMIPNNSFQDAESENVFCFWDYLSWSRSMIGGMTGVGKETMRHHSDMVMRCRTQRFFREWHEERW